MPIKTIGYEQWASLVESSDRPILVEFVSPTCSICAAMEPVVDRIAERFAGKASVYRVNAMQEQALAMGFGVRGTPSFLMLCKGRPIASLVGAVYPSLLERMVQEAIDHGSECASKQTKVIYEISGYA